VADETENKSNRDLLLKIANDVGYLVESRKDHEARLRLIENTQIENGETRIRSLEQKQWWLSGAAAGVGFLTRFIKL